MTSAKGGNLTAMRVAIVTESFLPTLNGVTTSVCRVLDCLKAQGHEAMVVAPHTGWASSVPKEYAGFPVLTVASIPVRQFRVGLPSYELESMLRDFDADVVHAASPFILGMRGLSAAHWLGIPTVAIYQTDMPSYIRQHSGIAGNFAAQAAWHWIRRIHALADLTLAPSSSALEDLRNNGVQRTALWGRGVDAELYRPDWRDHPQTQQLRRELAPNGETIIGYVGRLAPEKELHRLAEIHDMPGIKIAIVGDGPSREQLRHLLPRAEFLGRRSGEDLARCYAAMDVFVHTGTRETFGQTLQEAAASGLPVVAPAMGGPLDLIKQGTTGLLFDPNTTGALKRSVEQLVGPEHQELRSRMGLEGRVAVSERSWTNLVDQLVGHYRSTVTARRAVA